MRYDSISGVALITGSVMMLVTMLLHPTGHEMFQDLHGVAPLGRAVHALALASVPMLVFGTLGLTRRLGAGALATSALVTYAFASTAVLLAAVASGFLAPALMERILNSEGSERATLHALLQYNSIVNQAYARVFVVGSSAALVLWSLAVLQGRTLGRWSGGLGLVVGVLAFVAAVSGHLRLDVHGFGAVVLGQSIWLISVGAQMLRAAREATT